MPATYVDQVQKLEIRSMMAAAFKASPSDHYVVYQDGSGWHPAADHRAVPSGPGPVAEIYLDRAPAKGGLRPSRAQVFLKLLQPDGFKCEQALSLIAVPTRKRRLRWATFCPFSRQPAQTLYLSLDARQFVSRQVAGLKYRRPVRKVRNYHARRLAIMRELETDHAGRHIPRPDWMAEPLYQKLMQELVEMDCRTMAKALKWPQPDYWDEFDYADVKPERVNYPPGTVVFYNRNGVTKLKARYRKRYGLPAAAA
jgi:hypothetical protein